MPSTPVAVGGAHAALNAAPQHGPGMHTVSTPFGLLLLEIQGELNVPDAQEAIQFGRLQFDERDEKKVVLFIGTSQRLLGTVEPLPKPLGLLKQENGRMELVDVIHKRLLFKQRPLPIM